MADDNTDESQKTEDPSQKKLDDAREKGQVAKSQEVSHWFMLLAFASMIGVFGASLTQGLGDQMVRFLENPHAIRIDRESLGGLVSEVLMGVGTLVILPALVAIAAAVTSSFLQIGWLVSAESLKPSLEKISLQKGLKRLFSVKSLAEFAKGIAKLTLVGVIIVMMMSPRREMIPQITSMEVSQLLLLLQEIAVHILIGVLSIMAVIAGADFLFQKFQHTKQLMMSKQEIKDEFKQTEGDPIVKGRLRQLRAERARRRMMAAVPEADVVVTNPTHYAVALKYDAETMEAPILTAKGADEVALRIREMAKKHDVPVMENPPLARALYGGVELDEQIPPQHYTAVAEVIGYVMRLRGKMPKVRGT
ncbi:flagellar biosynthesis protein FlhB [Pelagibius sp. Alg239-R121]|uniref:flagellar biosynthesis protein FlhB n=1 Tax=Pelagibius sp. Alg239-R121 TaxID=2993448 RepID=UPI0024A6DAE2|nr:flagellar biosynthesis protein FlhB [Pelagibius sp. Alg239-R121]